MVGFADTLARQETRSREEGLVWVRDGNLSLYFRRAAPPRPPRPPLRPAPHRRLGPRARGGRKIVLHKPVSSAAQSRGKLLPAKR